MRAARKVFGLMLVALGLSGCQFFESLGFVPVTSTATAIQDAGIYCQVQANGVIFLKTVDPSLVAHNTVDIAYANKVCAAVEGIPTENTGATVPVHHTTQAGSDAATGTTPAPAPAAQ